MALVTKDLELEYLQMELGRLRARLDVMGRDLSALTRISENLSASISRLTSGSGPSVSSDSRAEATPAPSAPPTTTDFGKFTSPFGSDTSSESAGAGTPTTPSGTFEQPATSSTAPDGERGSQQDSAELDYAQPNCTCIPQDWGGQPAHHVDCTIWDGTHTPTTKPAPPAAPCEHPNAQRIGVGEWCEDCGALRFDADYSIQNVPNDWRLPQQQPRTDEGPDCTCRWMERGKKHPKCPIHHDDKVNRLDPEDCEACAAAVSVPCLYHEGIAAADPLLFSNLASFQVLIDRAKAAEASLVSAQVLIDRAKAAETKLATVTAALAETQGKLHDSRSILWLEGDHSKESTEHSYTVFPEDCETCRAALAAIHGPAVDSTG